MLRILAVLAAMAVVIAVPFALKPKGNLLARADDTLVIITPQNEAIRYEFTVAFCNYYKKKTGRTIRICLLYTSPSPRDRTRSRMPSSA